MIGFGAVTGGKTRGALRPVVVAAGDGGIVAIGGVAVAPADGREIASRHVVRAAAHRCVAPIGLIVEAPTHRRAFVAGCIA